jgi:hypothetical protein
MIPIYQAPRVRELLLLGDGPDVRLADSVQHFTSGLVVWYPGWTLTEVLSAFLVAMRPPLISFSTFARTGLLTPPPGYYWVDASCTGCGTLTEQQAHLEWSFEEREVPIALMTFAILLEMHAAKRLPFGRGIIRCAEEAGSGTRHALASLDGQALSMLAVRDQDSAEDIFLGSMYAM